MRQTLFYIPQEVAGLPLFGAGWMLIVWAVFSVALLAWLYRRHGWSRETISYLPVLAVLGAVIYFVLPHLEVPALGLPIRGYGALVLAGVVAGVGLAGYRGKRLGIDPDLIFSLAFWMFVAGIVCARLFYVFQKWSHFQEATPLLTLGKIVKYTEGGLVVYGALIGGLIAFALFCRKHRLSMLAVGDLIAPCMLLGLALGRLGCLMNGCCYGGVCDQGPFAITFPKYTAPELQTLSPPYQHQLEHGQLHGVRIGAGRDGVPVIKQVRPGSAAERLGAVAGSQIRRVNGEPVASLEDVRRVLSAGAPQIDLETSDGRLLSWTLAGFPPRSLPVHPTQIYSSINAFLLFLVLWFAYPFRTRDGQVLAWTLLLYAVTRFLLEIIRTDEVGWGGTALTISQWISLAALVAVGGLWLLIRRQPRLAGAPSGPSTARQAAS